jgi:uncharacterized protein (TIGR04255 family)
MIMTNSNILSLPSVERIVLKRSPLVLTLCQIQFTPVLSVVETSYVAPFQRAIQGMFPIVNPVLGMQVSLGGGDTGLLPTTTSQWEFTDRTSIWKVVLTQNFVSLETRSYTEFGDFVDRLKAVLLSLVEHIQPPVGTRIGLRYINEIRDSDFDWRRAVSPQMLGPLADSSFQLNAEQIAAVQQVNLRYAANRGVNINHGVIPSGTSIRLRPGEQVPSDGFYLLDFDVFQEFHLPDGLNMEADQIAERIEEYHDVIYRAFRWSVTDEYLANLEGD